MKGHKTMFESGSVYFGVTPTSWWNDDFLDIDIGIPYEQAFSEMALAGYEGCSRGHKYPDDIPTLKAALGLRGACPAWGRRANMEPPHGSRIGNLLQPRTHARTRTP